ncbi:hypothetical protein [Herbaspirillum sp.]|uniref:hypothetical protein n=1 Tax=Herbaspirillum sp. TaxID=1890675 RepID=UPI001B172E1A|nr:hypothetical protein [Herbaspirillum sp.]MBO9538077.1 hypothetical protein [Herbaspirillum sp.]
MDWPGAFALTLACELPVVFAATRPLPAPGVLLAAIGANCVTHPLAWRLSMALPPENYLAGAAGIETGVFLAEALWYRGWLRLGLGRACIVSLLANAASAITGWLLW